jgi:hypothetical protein
MRRYGFSKTDVNAWRFAHPEFRRGQPERLHLIQRKSSHRPHAASELKFMPEGEVDFGLDETPLQPVPQTAGALNVAAHLGGDIPLPETIHTAPDPIIFKQLEQVRAQSAVMMGRIAQLQSSVHHARHEQASSRDSIGKIMTFLSRVYTDHRITNAPVPVAGSLQPTLQQPPFPQLPPPQGSTATSSRDGDHVGSIEVLQELPERVSTAAAVAVAAEAAGLPPLHPMAPHLPALQGELERGGADLSLAGKRRRMDELLESSWAMASGAMAQYSSKGCAGTSQSETRLSMGGTSDVDMQRRGKVPALSAESQHFNSASRSLSTASLSANCVLPAMPAMAHIGTAPAVVYAPADGGPLAPVVGVPPTVAAGLPPGVLRDKSIGAQVAKALPSDLRSIALELVDSTRLQDETIAEVKEQVREAEALSNPASRACSPSAQELETYLWDFLETSQALDEAQDVAEAVQAVYESTPQKGAQR